MTRATEAGGGILLEVMATDLPEVKLLRPRRHGDARGWFAETWRRDRLAGVLGREVDFPQDNCSFSAAAGTVRGLHFQLPPDAQAKVVGVMAGAVLDVAVDLRQGSPRYGRHAAMRLSAEEGWQAFIPEGFAHGFCTLEPATLVTYKVSRVYAAAADRGLLWCDPDLAIAWPVAAGEAILSDKDRTLPRLAELPAVFPYEAN